MTKVSLNFSFVAKTKEFECPRWDIGRSIFESDSFVGTRYGNVRKAGGHCGLRRHLSLSNKKAEMNKPAKMPATTG